MPRSTAATPDEYLAELPPERREALSAVREVIRRNLPAGFEEGVAYGMIGYYVPLERLPDTYNGQPLGLAALASQKGHMAVYLNTVYGHPPTEQWFRERYAESGKRLDMGKSCVRFRKLADVPLDVVADTIARTSVDGFIAAYERGPRMTARA